MNLYIELTLIFLPVLLYGAYLLIQAERRRQERLSQRKAKRAHDDSVRKDYQDLMIELDNGRETTTHLLKDASVTFSHRFSADSLQTPYILYSVDKGTPKGDDVIHVTVGKDDTREIPTIEAENADCELSDVWVNAIEGLEIEE